jgi:hypothetical protein
MIQVNNVMTPVVSGLSGLVVSAVGTYLGVHWKIMKDLLAKYDESLRGHALTLMDAIAFSYRFLQSLVDPADPNGKLIAFLNTFQPLVPVAEAFLHPDPCHQLDPCHTNPRAAAAQPTTSPTGSNATSNASDNSSS